MLPTQWGWMSAFICSWHAEKVEEKGEKTGEANKPAAFDSILEPGQYNTLMFNTSALKPITHLCNNRFHMSQAPTIIEQVASTLITTLTLKVTTAAVDNIDI